MIMSKPTVFTSYFFYVDDSIIIDKSIDCSCLCDSHLFFFTTPFHILSDKYNFNNQSSNQINKQTC